MTGFDDLVGDKKESGKKLVNHVAFLLDHSGSMHHVADRSRDDFNEYLQTLREESIKQETRVTLVSFNEEATIEYFELNINHVDDMDFYKANGGTALYDSIGKTASKMFEDVPELRDSDSNHSALIIIITDGYDNASTEFAKEQGRIRIKEMIKKYEKDYNFTFTFLGATIDVKEVAEKGFGMSAGNTVCFDSLDDMGAGRARMKKGLTDYYTARSVGVTKTASFYDNSTIDDQTDTVQYTCEVIGDGKN
jgi:uncharacterized protein YegL